MKRFKFRKYAIGILTFSIALAIGLIVQYSDAFASRVNGQSTVAVATQPIGISGYGLEPAAVRSATPQSFNLPETPRVERLSVPIDSIPSELTAPQIILPTGLDSIQSSELQMQISDIVLTSLNVNDSETIEIFNEIQNAGATEINSSDCELTAIAGALKMAVVQLSISAPCRQNASFTVHHQGMSFDYHTDEFGNATINIPALSENAVFLTSFEDGKSVMAETLVTDLSEYDRAVLLWSGSDGLQLHAREFGASYGGNGHVWRGDHGQFAGTISSVSGLLDELGQVSRRAEIYTYPSSHGIGSGNIQLSVDAEVTETNCGQEIYGQTLRFEQGQLISSTDLNMTMPSCDAIGEFIVLKNVFEDLTLALK